MQYKFEDVYQSLEDGEQEEYIYIKKKEKRKRPNHTCIPDLLLVDGSDGVM